MATKHAKIASWKTFLLCSVKHLLHKDAHFEDGCTVLPMVEQMAGYQVQLEELEEKRDPTVEQLAEMLGLSSAIDYTTKNMLKARTCDNCPFRLH